MKRTDIAMIVLIVAVSAGIAYFVANSLFGGKTENGVTVKTIDPITSVIQSPDASIFNKDAINPSIEVTVSGSSSSAGATTTNPSSTTP
jgi:hypothetical protein